MTTAEREHRLGVAFAVGAYGLWGFLPLYFRLLQGVDPVEVVAQRVLWSLLLLGGLLLAFGRIAAVRAVLADPRALRILAATAALIAVNWLIYVWAVMNGHVLATSLGYYLNPLVNVAMGVVILKERLTRLQAIAVGLAAIGVAVLAARALDELWISLTLAFSFASYGLLRKIAPADAMEGLSVETLFLAPVALGAVLWIQTDGRLAMGDGIGISVLLVLAGAVTAVPLLLFAAGARRLRLSTMGLLQFIAPTLQFVLAITVFGERMTTAHAVCFAFIWSGLTLYLAETVRSARRPAQEAPAAGQAASGS